MAWQIEWSAEAAKDIRKIEDAVAKRIIKKIEVSSHEPLKYLERLAGYEDYKLRIGDYRVLCMLDHAKKVIFIEKIGHRKNIYKKLGK